MSVFTFFQAKRNHCLQLVQCFRGWIFVCCPINDNPDGLQSVDISHEFAGWLSFGIKLSNFSDAMPA